MSELINNNAAFRKETLRKLILELHEGKDPVEVRHRLKETLKDIPYDEVVEVEQQLMREGLPQEEVLRLCDVHGEVLDGMIDKQEALPIPEGHPLDVMIHENQALFDVIEKASSLLDQLEGVGPDMFTGYRYKLQGMFNELMDVDKHYQRKEYLLFPYLERAGITGPPAVMWGKHDEIRAQLKGCIELLRDEALKPSDLEDALEILVYPTLKALAEMTTKEEDILFPMAMDVLTLEDWWQIHKQTLEYGFTLYDPKVEWQPEGLVGDEHKLKHTLNEQGALQLPSGSFTAAEIMAILNTLPVDLTFVDKNDKVKYFTQGNERVFQRSRSIINRDVRLCHPPGSVHIVEKILEDFKSGKASHAPFWIQSKGQFIHIEYYALRDEQGEYLGTLEVSQNLTSRRQLEGEQRILSYTEKK